MDSNELTELLKALGDMCGEYVPNGAPLSERAYKAIHSLQSQEAEPVAWYDPNNPNDIAAICFDADDARDHELDTGARLVPLVHANTQPIEAQEAEPVEFEDYDSGLINDFGGGDVDWWQDYVRAEVGRANDFWRHQVDTQPPKAQEAEPVAISHRQIRDLAFDGANDHMAAPGCCEDILSLLDASPKPPKAQMEDLERLIEFAAVQGLALRDGGDEVDACYEQWRSFPDHLQGAINAIAEARDEGGEGIAQLAPAKAQIPEAWRERVARLIESAHREGQESATCRTSTDFRWLNSRAKTAVDELLAVDSATEGA